MVLIYIYTAYRKNSPPPQISLYVLSCSIEWKYIQCVCSDTNQQEKTLKMKTDLI